jgi:hypothetical protein
MVLGNGGGGFELPTDGARGRIGGTSPVVRDAPGTSPVRRPGTSPVRTWTSPVFALPPGMGSEPRALVPGGGSRSEGFPGGEPGFVVGAGPAARIEVLIGPGDVRVPGGDMRD